MGPMQLDAVRPGHLRDTRTVHERLFDLFDLRDRKRARSLAAEFNRRGGDGLLAAEGVVAAGMVELDEHLGAVFVQSIHKPLEPLQISTVSGGELAGFARARSIHNAADP